MSTRPKSNRWLQAIAVLALVLPPATATADPHDAQNAPRATLRSFQSDAELMRFLKSAKRRPPPPPVAISPQPTLPVAPLPPPPPASSPAPAKTPQFRPRAAAEKSGDSENITNTQEAEVDEGGIVKMHGNTLVILRRGRLFTVSTADGQLRTVDSIDAYPPGVDVGGDWYDEMLVAGDRVVVIGYSYSRGGTEINRFRITREGRLSFEDAYHLRSNDYYSSENYASRLIGTRLIAYGPLYLPYGEFSVGLPAMRRWTGDASAKFKRLVTARQIYARRGGGELEASDIEALHTVTSCDLAAAELNCSAISVLGPMGRTFYVSSHAAYVWVGHGWDRDEGDPSPASVLYRLPLDGRPPSAIGVRGAPPDQFSFDEDWERGRLNVLVRAEGSGDAMWNAGFSEGAVSLLRLPLNRFGDGAGEVPRRFYRALPSPNKDEYGFTNRFVGDYVLYASGRSWWREGGQNSVLVVAAVRENRSTQIPFKHGIDRIEAMGLDAVAVGADPNDLHFRAIELTQGPEPALGDTYTMKGASQGETRSHAFFFKPEPMPDDTTAGVLALPVARAARPAYRQLLESSASILFLRRSTRKFSALGELVADEAAAKDDGCKASCVDWYGNARPIFLRDRTFALMGYELVEGEIGPNSIRELRRANFAPAGP